MNMFRSLFFVAVATVVVSGNVSAVGGALLKNMEKPAMMVPILLIASQSKHLNNNTKYALHAAAASSLDGGYWADVVNASSILNN